MSIAITPERLRKAVEKLEPEMMAQVIPSLAQECCEHAARDLAHIGQENREKQIR